MATFLTTVGVLITVAFAIHDRADLTSAQMRQDNLAAFLCFGMFLLTLLLTTS